MDKDLHLLQFITNLLVFLSKDDPVEGERTLGIGSYEKLANYLNEIGYPCSRKSWTGHALECRFARIRKKYTKAQLYGFCDKSDAGTVDWEAHPHRLRPDIISLEDTDPKITRARVTKYQTEHPFEYDDCVKSWTMFAHWSREKERKKSKKLKKIKWKK